MTPAARFAAAITLLETIEHDRRPADALVGGLRAGMGYTGSNSVGELQRNARFRRVTGARQRDGVAGPAGRTAGRRRQR